MMQSNLENRMNLQLNYEDGNLKTLDGSNFLKKQNKIEKIFEQSLKTSIKGNNRERKNFFHKRNFFLLNSYKN